MRPVFSTARRILTTGVSLPRFCHSAGIMAVRNSPPTIKVASGLKDSGYDGVILVSSEQPGKQSAPFSEVLSSAVKINAAVANDGGVFAVDLPAGRFVYAPTSNVTTDYADVRSFREAAAAGIKKAIKAGIQNPLLVLPTHPRFKNAGLVTLLGALEALYVNDPGASSLQTYALYLNQPPIAIREEAPDKLKKPAVLGVWSEADSLKDTVQIATFLEEGRFVARDIGGGDPERMAGPRIEEYVRKVFANSNISIEVHSDPEILVKEYPLLAAVNRAASVIERHRGRVILLTYEPPSEAEQTLFFVGKGVTYDTGGADVKVGGGMIGMSRDKCGAAAAAGIMKVISELKPSNTKAVAALCVVRNSIGENSYVADEVITARSKARVRVVNTDAEGRMAMADPLCQMREAAVSAKNPHIFTIATLTGHACLTAGDGYSIAIDNGPAREEQNAQKLQSAGEAIGEPLEVSVLRREDISANAGTADAGEDLTQTNTVPSAKTLRGHQRPAGFLLQVSGLDKHGRDSDRPIKYTHLDIAASAGDVPHDPTGAPILALTARYLLPKLG